MARGLRMSFFRLPLVCALMSGEATDVIGGTGQLRWRYLPDRLQLPPGVQMQHGHGLAQDHEGGNIYFTYVPMMVAEGTRVLIRFDPNGKETGQLLGSDNTLSLGVPHGLRISYEDDQAYLYHANNQQLLHKTTLDGTIVWSTNLTAEFSGTKYWPFLPTDAVVPPGSPVVYVADGYGSSFVHHFDVKTGKYLNVSFGGGGSSTRPQRFNCPHGINYDNNRDLLVISDRGNNRLQYVTRDGNHVETVDLGPASALGIAGHMPCNVDLNRSSFSEDQPSLLVPSLDGIVGILSRKIQVLSVLNVSSLLGDKCPHPHDAILLDNGDMVLCCWNPGHLSYWQKYTEDQSAGIVI